MPTKEAKKIDSGLAAMVEGEKVLRAVANIDDPSQGYQVPLTPSDAVKLRVLGLPADKPNELRRKFGRIFSEAELAEAGGTAEEFAEATKAAATAAKEFAAKRDELQHTIRRAQAELTRLEGAERVAQGRLDAMKNARQRLRDPKQWPLFVQGRVAAIEHAMRGEVGIADQKRLAKEREDCIDRYVNAVCEDFAWCDGDLQCWMEEVC